MISKKTISRYKILLMLLVVIGVGVSFTMSQLHMSINPLYSDETVVFEPAFLGTWTAGDEGFVVEKRGDEYYTVTARLSGDDWLNPLEVHLVQLGQHYFVDIYPEDDNEALNKGYYPYLPTHAFLAFELEGDVLKLGMLDDDWLQEKLESGETDIKYARPPGDRSGCPYLVGLGSSTEELQRFFLKYGEDEDAFEWEEFQKQKR
ncbi:MAG: hypothetical protein V3W17_00185 [Desulfobacteria bacterium]